MLKTWWIKIILKIIFFRLPIKYKTWKKLGLFVHGQMNNPKYSYGVFQHHFLKVKKFLPDNFTLCELGSGDSISTALIAPCFGSSKTYLIDNGNFATRDISEYKKLYDFLTKKGFNGLVFDTSFDFNDILLNNNSYYLTKGINDLKKLETNSIDYVFSQATLEHIAFHDFIATQEQIHRILKPSGIVSHNIDLRDHLVGGLNNLRFSERIWEFDLMAKSGFYTNRIRYSQMLNIFKKTGFNVDAVIIETWDKLPIPRSKLSHDFRNLSEKDLCISVFDVLLKPK